MPTQTHPGGLYQTAAGTYQDASGAAVDVSGLDAATREAYGVADPKATKAEAAKAKADGAPKAKVDTK